MAETGDPIAAEDPAKFLDALVFDDTAAPQQLPPTIDEIEHGMVTIPLNLPKEMRDRLREVAAAHCITPTMLIRQFIDMGLAAEQLAAAAAAGELIFGETLDAATVLPSREVRPDSAPDSLT
ncbi:hypothetical protein [Nocardia sp. NPDC020380]|uniref:hypothetical protein n=1 Tax=Nocardia sp. NPDC020380 TaxID=3364309 RepID=UPI0037A5D440